MPQTAAATAAEAEQPWQNSHGDKQYKGHNDNLSQTSSHKQPHPQKNVTVQVKNNYTNDKNQTMPTVEHAILFKLGASHQTR